MLLSKSKSMALGSIFKVIIDETSLLHSIPVPLDFKTVYSKDKFSVFLQHIKFYSIIDILLLDLSFINSFLDLQLVKYLCYSLTRIKFKKIFSL